MSRGPAARRVTLLDVAARAEVDRSIVSRVLSGDPALNVREETRQRVLAAVHELDYRPNAVARSLRTRQAEAFGLLIPDFGNPIYASIITGAEAAAADKGRVLLTGSLASGLDLQQYIDRLGQGRIDGLLIAGAETSGEVVARLEASGLPWLLLNRRLPGSRRYIILDDEQAAALAVDHLIELGHRRIAHLAGPEAADTAQRRRDGYVRTMERAGLAVDERLVVPSDYSNAGGVAGIRRLLQLDDPPTAVFVANVAAAIGALAGARELGVEVPGALSIVAVHDLPLAGYLQPPLTTVRMPLEALAARAIELLSTEPAPAAIEEVLRRPIQLVVRGSTAAPR